MAILVFISMMSLGVYMPRSAGAVSVIENSGGALSARNWLESLAMADDTRGNVARVTAVVRHDFGVQVDQLQFDDDWDGTANEVTKTFGVTPQKPSGSFNYSRVSFSFNPARPSGFTCGFLSGTRRQDNRAIHMRARTTDGLFTPWVAGEMDVVEDSQCIGATDYAYLYQWSQSGSSITPGQSVTFTFRGDDADQSGSNDRFARYHWRVRRLNDGAIVQGPSGDVGACGDNCDNNLTVAFSQRGRYVVEAELGGEDGFENAGRWFWIGAVDVNTAQGTSPTVSLSGPSGIVQRGATVTISASTTDTEAFQGRVQMIEWDAENNGTFERREVAATEAGGLTTTQREQSIDTTGFSGSRTVTARVTDNGAISGADNIRRTAQDSFTFVINRAPVANDQTENTSEDDDVSFTLNASDPDADTLTYTITNPTDSGTLSGSGASRTYTPDANFNGTDSFAYTVTDGRGGTDDATVTVNVAAVNDAPVAQDQSVTTAEDTLFSGTLSATDVDDAANDLSFSLGAGASNGTATVSEDGAFTYMPGANFHGTDGFTFEACDPDGACDEGEVEVTVSSVNDPPVPVDQDVTTDEDVDLPITLSATDADGDALIFGTTAPAHGTLTGIAPNVVYTPDENYFGPDTFMFSVSDGTVTVTGTVDITVNPVNDAPVAQDQAVATDEDTTLNGVLTAIDVDDAAGDLTFELTGGPSNGSVVVNPDGSFTYTPNENYNGPDGFTFEVCDPDDVCDEGTVDITVNPVNDAPVPADQDVTTDEDTPLPITLSATDADGDTLTFGIATPPTNGTLTGVAPNLQYAPNENYFGPDTFTFSVSDGSVTITGTVDITVNPVNDAPVAQNQAAATDEDTLLGGTLVATDVDDVAADLTFSLAGSPANGTAVVGPSGSFTYTPDENYNGPDAFTFRACDPDNACDEATVDITVNPVNDVPVAEPAAATLDEDETAVIGLSASDVDGDALNFTFPEPAHGTVVGAGPEIAYTPDPNYNGPDSFAFTVSDGHGGTAEAAVTITVNAVNDPPDAIPQILTTSEDTPLAVTLTANDLDGDEVEITVTDGPDHGSISGSEPVLTYTPDPDFSGSDFITFTACDPSEACDAAVISITVVEAPLIATVLEAEPTIVRLKAVANPLGTLKVKVPLTLRATLTVSDSPEGLPGKMIEFRLGGQFVCSATTDGQGVASCGGVVAVLRSTLAFGYEALFAGDADYGPSLDQGPIVIVNDLQL